MEPERQRAKLNIALRLEDLRDPLCLVSERRLLPPIEWRVGVNGDSQTLALLLALPDTQQAAADQHHGQPGGGTGCGPADSGARRDQLGAWMRANHKHVEVREQVDSLRRGGRNRAYARRKRLITQSPALNGSSSRHPLQSATRTKVERPPCPGP